MKKMWNMRLTVTSIVVSALGTVPEGLKKKKLEELEIRGRIETLKTSTLLRSAKILRRVLMI